MAEPIPGRLASSRLASAILSISASISAFFSASLLMSSFQPTSLLARRTFCPFFPIASESWSSETMTSISRAS